MITLNDCRALCDVDSATVARVARNERLPEILAIACAQSRVTKARCLHGRHPAVAAFAARTARRLAA